MSGDKSTQSTLGGRVRRYARVTGAMGGLAARLAGERYLGVAIDRQRHAAELKEVLGSVKGPLMKVAQILSTIPEALPPEYVQELSQLQANAPPMGWPFVRRRMVTELGSDWQGRFASFEHQASRAASLGQVHQARAHDGRTLACKLQYPDMQSAVEADLRQLRLVFQVFERYDRAVSTKHIHEELDVRLREELDYVCEARHLKLYREMLAPLETVRVPEVIDDLSTRRLLTMTWEDGTPLLNLADAPLERRNRIASNLFHAWYVPFYRYGVIHGDPHLGNYTACPDDTINLLDFGCIRVFPSAFVGGVIDLYRALQNDDTALAVHAYESWGFGNLTREKIEILNQWAAFIYGPLLEDRVRPIQEGGDGVYGREVAEKVHAELRQSGGITPPREFVLMDRAALGLGSVFMHLKAEMNWYQLFNRLIEGFDAAGLESRQGAALAAAGLPPAVPTVA